MEHIARSRYEELLTQAHTQHLIQEQVVSALAELIDFNDTYIQRRKRRGRQTDVDAFLLRVAPALALAIELLQQQQPVPTTPNIEQKEHTELSKQPQTPTIQVKLWLRVENSSKYVRAKSHVRQVIEALVLAPYQMQKLSPDGWEYILTLPYTSDSELDILAYELLQEAESIADRHACFTEADMYALDDETKRW